MEVGAWLKDLGLGQYEAAFRENHVDAEVLPSLTSDDLKDLGVNLVGDRRRLLDAIAELRPGDPSTTSVAATASPDPSSTVRAEPPAETQHSQGAGERRHLTVMFCDLVGSTEIAGRLDAEEWRDIVAEYHVVVASAVARFGGYVAKNLGDGALIYFGYPHAQENEAECAVRAGLAVIDDITSPSRSTVLRGAGELAVRVGIHAGVVVIGDGGEVYGDVPNIASRVQTVSEPNIVMITSDVHRLVAGLFVVNDRGSQTLKGVPEAVALFEVTRASGVGRRSSLRALTPLVGREEEMRHIESRWNRARAGQGQLVLVFGEAGIGKSRLVEEFQLRLAEQPHTWSELACSQLSQNTPLFPLVEGVKRRLEEMAPPPGNQVEALIDWIAAVGLDPQQAIPLVAPLLGLATPDDYPAPPAAPAEQRRRLLSTLAAWIVGSARTQPLVLNVEDIHWADPSTLDLLQILAEQSTAVPMMLLITSRPEFRAPWHHRSHHSMIALAPLDAGEAQKMVREIVARQGFQHQTIEAVLARTGGVPLFIEEVTRLLIERDGQLAMQSIPATLQALLTARLDRLGPAREVGQIASMLGREFTYRLIRAVSGLDEGTLTEALDCLVEADLLQDQGAPPDSSYRFNHVLVQEAAYDGMLKSRRRELHLLIATALRETFSEVVATQPELLAHHLTQSGVLDEAIPTWQRAGQQATERSANLEAIAHFSHGLELIPLLPQGEARDRLELDLRVGIGVPLIASRGYAALEVEKTYARARELSQTLGGDPQFANIIWGQWVRYLTGGPIGACLEMAEQYKAVAERTQDSGHRLETCQVMGIALLYLGRPDEALPHLERGDGLYEPERHHALVYEHGGADTGVAIRTHEALALWTLGYPEQARARMDHALETAKSLTDHPFTLAFAHYFDGWLHKLCRDEAAARQSTEIAIRICDELRFPFWGLASSSLHGSTLVEAGQVAEGVAAMRQALDAYGEIGGQLYRPELTGLLAIGLARAGKSKDALQAIEEALQTVDQTNEGWWRAELLRVRGELILSISPERGEEAEVAFQDALAEAQRQKARSWELRAATSLARVWDGQGRRAEASELLQSVLAGFSEGFQTADLREAAGLRDELTAKMTTGKGRAKRPADQIGG